MKIIALSLSALAIFAASAPNASAADLLTGEEIAALASGAKWKGRAQRGGGTWTTETNADGSATFAMDDYSFSDSGSWRVKGDVYCSKWKTIRDGAEACYALRPTSGGKYELLSRDGRRDLKVTVTKN
ncbi:MAG: hypothetical protein AAFP78_06150 [Pseudomonadota bacterium]